MSFGASKPATDRHFESSHPGHSPLSTLHSSFELGRLGSLGPLGTPCLGRLKKPQSLSKLGFGTAGRLISPWPGNGTCTFQPFSCEPSIGGDSLRRTPWSTGDSLPCPWAEGKPISTYGSLSPPISTEIGFPISTGGQIGKETVRFHR